VFRLHKWFLDCTTEAGEVVVVYTATLQWGLLRLRAAATLARLDPGAPAVTTTRLGRTAIPRQVTDGFTFADERLDVHGDWRGSRGPAERILFANTRGDVRWHCHLPLAAVEVHHRGRVLRGTGYVEHLALEIAPWHLPIEVLRWGRFHGGGRSLVWIQWDGPHPLRLVLRDGGEVGAGPIDDAGTTLADGDRLELAPSAAVLRSGRIGKTALTQRLLRWLPLPRALRALDETKWLAPARLHTAAGIVAGQALHEVVRWG
jgi:hypothetical protein